MRVIGAINNLATSNYNRFVLFAIKLSRRSFRAGKRSLTRFTAIVSIVGIAAGIAAFIVAYAIGNGFRVEMQEKLIASTPNISIFLTDRSDIVDSSALAGKIQNLENVSGITPFRIERVILAGSSEIGSAMMHVRADSSGSSIDIGSELAKRLSINENSIVEVITVEGDDPGRRTRLKVGSIIKTGLFDQDSQLVDASPRVFSALTGNDFVPNTLNVSVNQVFRSNRTADLIRNTIGEQYRVIDWQEANQPLFAALELERKGGFVVISLIIFIAVLGITTTLTLLVNDRRHDIAVLRACGAKSRHILEIFIFEGMFLGAVGTAIGVVIGLALCFLSNRFRFLSLDAEVYLINYIPLTPTASMIAAVCAFALLLCLSATLYPAFLATRTRPIEDLRR